jgi:hypothetical protein
MKLPPPPRPEPSKPFPRGGFSDATLIAIYVAIGIVALIVALAGCTGNRFDHRSDMCKRFVEMCKP